MSIKINLNPTIPPIPNIGDKTKINIRYITMNQYQQSNQPQYNQPQYTQHHYNQPYNQQQYQVIIRQKIPEPKIVLRVYILLCSTA
ncbi:MAG: hypothetical protein RLZZ69_3666 [Cyanobacteriota bacterium]